LMYPRAAALAEVLWSPSASRNYNAFVKRMQPHLARLAALGVHYSPLPNPSSVLPVRR
jgi:hexosaminidase